jgi:hypothetical protein
MEVGFEFVLVWGNREQDIHKWACTTDLSFRHNMSKGPCFLSLSLPELTLALLGSMLVGMHACYLVQDQQKGLSYNAGDVWWFIVWGSVGFSLIIIE